MKSKKPKWAKALNKKELQHVVDAGPGGRALLRTVKTNAQNELCIDCRIIARKVGVK
jgi:hypothetical protein